MATPIKRLVEHAYYSKGVTAKGNESSKVSFMLHIDQVSMSDEQNGKLLDILDRAAAEAEIVLKD